MSANVDRSSAKLCQDPVGGTGVPVLCRVDFLLCPRHGLEDRIKLFSEIVDVVQGHGVVSCAGDGSQKVAVARGHRERAGYRPRMRERPARRGWAWSGRRNV